MTSCLRSDNGPYKEFSVVTVEGGLQLIGNVVFPVRMQAIFVPGGWRRTANDGDEFQQILQEGLERSSVGEVLISWNTDKIL